MDPPRKSDASGAKRGRQSYRPIAHWRGIIQEIFKGSIGDAKRAEKAKEFARLLRDETPFNFATLTSVAFEAEGVKTKQAEFLMQHQLIESILSRLEPSKIRDAEAGDEDAAAFAIISLWRILQMPAEQDGLDYDKWRDPRYKAYVEKIFRVPQFFSRVLDCLTADCYHTSRTAAWIACFVIKVLRLGAKAAIWRDVVPLVATAIRKYDVSLMYDELNNRPLLSLLYFRSPKDLTPDLINLQNAVGLTEAFLSLAVALYPAIIAEDHECLFAALTPELIDCVRHHVKHPSLGTKQEATLTIANPVMLVTNLLVQPRKICETQHEMYERRMVKMFQYWPTMADDLAAICDKMCSIDYVVRMMNGQKELVESVMQMSNSIVQCCLDVFWTLAGMDKYLIKLRDHAKLFARMIDAGYASKHQFPKTPAAAERFARIFTGGWIREMDADRAFDDFGPGVTCAVMRPYHRQALLNCLARLTIQFSESRAAVGSAAQVWAHYVSGTPQEAEYAKRTGNNYFQEKDYWAAVICYRMSAELSKIILGYYNFTQPPQSDINEMKQLACIAHSNAAQCYIELKQWRPAAREAKFALYYVPNHDKSKARFEIASKAMDEIIRSKFGNGLEPDGSSLELEELGLTVSLQAVSSVAELKALGIELPPELPEAHVQEPQNAPSAPAKKRRRRRRRRGANATTGSSSSSVPNAKGSDDADDGDEELECVVCFEPQSKPLGTHPCGHGPLCYACYEEGHIRSCPICRQPFQKLIVNPKSGFKFFFSKNG
eukprot:TRINITY_DN6968_c0_g1_i1.p1 TRINITY_DN6968_c0_g1~~TRINITY_DN6968_c0_g1_i1.p1  ORF type:complete len:773 (+),score=136.71 TRINITY_DN6968_c0_g1_i1:50-2368(+)